MAALNKIARNEADTIRDGIAWLIVWKVGRSWYAESLSLDIEDKIEPEDLSMVHEILKKDSNAVMLNGYYCGYLGENMTVAEIEAGIRWHYENGYNLLKDSTALSSESLQYQEDISEDMPWDDEATNAECNSYLYNNYMSVKDYELMHERMDEGQQSEKHTSDISVEQIKPNRKITVSQIIKNADDVAKMMNISKSTAYRVIKQLNDELYKQGKIIIHGKVSRRYFEEKVYY